MRWLDNVWAQAVLTLCLGLSLTLAFSPYDYAYIPLFSITAFLVLISRTQHPKLIGFLFGCGWFGEIGRAHV